MSVIKVIFMAAKYSEPYPYLVSRNVERARVYSQEVARLGALGLTPPVIGAHFEGIQNYEWWAEAYIQLLRRCDAVFMVPHWEHSPGARKEHEEADRLGIPVFYHLSELKEWLNPTHEVEEVDEHTPYE
jgi:hypothetical protein